jgi:hypothetical protein
MKLDQKIYMGVGNLHDVFLNASLIKKYMDDLPIETEQFFDSDRGRFERIWVAFLYVLIEAWEANKEIRDYIATKVDLDELSALIKEGKKDGSIKKMQNTRHYIAHRDKRGYWDAGRLSVLGQLKYHIKLHNTFSKILLIAMKEMVEEAKNIKEIEL